MGDVPSRPCLCLIKSFKKLNWACRRASLTGLRIVSVWHSWLNSCHARLRKVEGFLSYFPTLKTFFTHGGFEGNKKFPKVENDFGCSFVKIIHWQWFRRQNIWFDEGTVLLSAILHEPIQQGECICIHKQPLNILYLPSSMHWLIDWLIFLV